MKYKLKASSVHIAGRVYKKSGLGKDFVFDTEDKKFEKIALEIEAAFKAGFLEEVEAPKKETVKQNVKKSDKK